MIHRRQPTHPAAIRNALEEAFPEAEPGKFDLLEGSIYWIFEAGDRWIGCCAAEPRFHGEVWVLRASYVLPSHRRRRIFRQLFEARLRYLEAKRPAPVLVGSANEQSWPLYQEHGFDALPPTRWRSGYKEFMCFRPYGIFD